MMKKWPLLSLVSLSLVAVGIQAEPERNRKITLAAAIENVDVKLVEKLLKREGIADHNSRKLLVEKAQNAVDECEENVSLLRSRSDCARFVGWLIWTGCGTAVCIKGLDSLLNSSRVKGIEKQFGFLMAGVAVCSAFGLYSLAKAWKCPTALGRLENACIIEDLVKSAPLSHTSDPSK